MDTPKKNQKKYNYTQKMKNILFVLLFALQFTFAQNETKKDTTKIENLNEVLVTANRGNAQRSEIPLAISKLSTQVINETKATSMDQLMNKIPGVLMVNLGNEQHAMSIRQPMSYNNYFLYLEDGIPIHPLGVFNHNEVLEINQFNLQNIEVIKGPASSLYGPEAIGGTVNYISLKPTTDPEFKIGVQTNNYGYRNFQAFGSATVGKFGFTLSGVSSDQKNSWLKFSDYSKNNINSQLTYQISKNTLLTSNTFLGKYYSDQTGSVNEQDFYNRDYKSFTDFSYRKSYALRTRLTLDQDWNKNSHTFLTIYHRDNEIGQNPAYAIYPNATNPNLGYGQINSINFKSYGAIAQHTQRFRFLNTKFIGGGSYDFSPNDYYAYQIDLKANLNPSGTVNYYQILQERPDIQLSNYNAKIYNEAAYAQMSIEPIKGIIVTGGVRYDNIKINYDNNVDKTSGSKSYDKTTFKFGINYNLNKNSGFYYNYAQGFAPPGVTSIFKLKPLTGGTTGNPAEFNYDLVPAQFKNYELGGWFSILKNKLYVDYAFYYLDGRNELLNLKQPFGSGYQNYQASAGHTRHKGIEFGVNYKPSQEWAIRVSGTTAQHTNLEFVISTNPADLIKDYNGLEMISAPKWIGNSEVTYYPKWAPKLRAGIEWQMVSSWYQNDINTIKYDGYNVFNARIGYEYKGIELSINGLNIADKLYAYNVTRGNQPNSVAGFTAAAPRIIMFGLHYNFKLKK